MTTSVPALITSTGAQYEILSPISGGADWVLYEASLCGGDRGLLRIFDYSISPRRKGHVMSRARLIRELDLPGIAKILDVGELVDGRPYTFMEGRGDSLLISIQQAGPLTAAEVFGVAAQLTQILERAFVQGLTYLDLRPDSVQVHRSAASSSVPGRLRALLLPGDMLRYSRPATVHQVTLAEEAFGLFTPAMQPYVAPELKEGGVVDERTVAFAVGALLHDLLYGATPRGGKTSTSSPHIPEDPARSSLIEFLVELVRNLYQMDILQRPNLSDVAQHLLWLNSLSEMMSGVLLGGKYQLRRIIALGGHGAVCEADNTKLGNRRVAIKILYPHIGDARVTQEINAAIAAGATHPDIVDILDHGVLFHSGPYIVMEYLTGETLSGRLRRLGCMTEPEAVRIIRMIAAPLKAAHAAGVIHRDLKPDNVMMVSTPTMSARERVKILDFGIARVSGALNSPRLTRAGTVMGTPNYMAPEQFLDAASATDRADVFALGAILFELLGGNLPISVQMNRQLRRVGSHQIMALIIELTAPDPAARPSMAEVERRLAQIEYRPTRQIGLAAIGVILIVGLMVFGAVSVGVLGRGEHGKEHKSSSATTTVASATLPAVGRQSTECRSQRITAECIRLPIGGSMLAQQGAVVRKLAVVGVETLCAGDRIHLSHSGFVETQSASGTSYFDETRTRRFWESLHDAPDFPEYLPKRIEIDCSRAANPRQE